MSDPIRLREHSAELDAALDDAALDPPAGMEDLVWGRLESAIAAGSPSASADASPKAAAPSVERAASPFAMKAMVVGVAAVVAVSAAVLARRDTPVVATPARDAPVAVAPVATLPKEAPAPPPTVAVEALPAVPSSPASAAVRRAPSSESPATRVVAPSPSDLLAKETAAVLDVRAHVRAGAGEVALERLSALDALVPGGTLREERESLRIEALVLAGRTEEARSEAEAFAARYPASPHLPRVRRLTQTGR